MKTRNNSNTEMETKRKATSDLNHDNWDNDEEPEEKGTFQEASEDVLKKRVIKKARRNLTSAATNDSPGTKTLFSGFAGFTSNLASTTTPSGSGSPFSFLSKLSQSSSQQEKTEPAVGTLTKVQECGNQFAFDKSSTYYSKLKGLNQTVSDWIKKHVDKNPLCILSPIFKDYEKYLKEIQEEKPEGSVAATTSTVLKFGTPPASNAPSIASNVSPQPVTPKFSFGFSGSTADSKKNDSDSIFSKIPPSSQQQQENKLIDFSFKPTSDVPDVASSKSSIFSSTSSSAANSAASSTTLIPTGFTFSSSKPFTFGSNVTKPPESKEEGEGDEDEPPKVEFTPVVEEDNVYSKRCKVFVKAQGSFADRGIGTLYLKPIKDSEKTQLIVRADTNLGNILINFILNESIPAQRMGKNNVMMVCIPTPESDPKPTSILLRVKTGEEADELLNTIEKYKK